MLLLVENFQDRCVCVCFCKLILFVRSYYDFMLCGYGWLLLLFCDLVNVCLCWFDNTASTGSNF
jgi:hypothetical protein